MITSSFSTTTLNSFYLWLDSYIQQNGQAYINTSSRLYYQPDTRLDPSCVAYASPFKSWVYNSGVSGATIAGIVSGTMGTISRGQSGLQIDYPNGRVILPAIVGTNAVLSGSYAFPDFNLYFANQTAEQMVFTNKYYLNSRFNRPITGLPPPYAMVTPCVFITDYSMSNENWAFGGLYNSAFNLTVNVLAENLGQLENLLSILGDARYSIFPQLGANMWPLGPSGDYKSGYNYQTILSQYGTPGNCYTVIDVSSSKISDFVKIDEALFLGVVDFKLEKPRTIH